MGSPKREQTGTGAQPCCRSFAMLSRSSATRHAVMLGARAIGSQARGLSPRTGGLAVDSPCPHLLSKWERCRFSQVSALCTLCSCMSTSGWWGGHPVNTYPVGTRFGTPPALCTLSSLSTSGRWGSPPMNTYPVGTRFGTPLAPCTLSSTTLAVTKVQEYLPSASNDETSRLETPCWAGSSMCPLNRGLSPRYPGSAGVLVWRLDRAQFILRLGWSG